MCVCVFVRNRRPHRLTPGAEIWHGGPHPPRKGQRVCLDPLRGRSKSASGGPWSPNGAFLGKLYRTKVEEHAQFSGDGSSQIWSQTSPRCPAGGPSARGASADLVPWLFGLKLGREMSTHPGRSTPVFGMGTPTPTRTSTPTPTPRVRGP